jgi:hypothetical protein
VDKERVSIKPEPVIDIVEHFGEEMAEWVLMTPQQRWEESSKLWDYYLSMGGSLDPEPDPQSPFFDPDEQRTMPVDGRPGVHIVRRGGV